MKNIYKTLIFTAALCVFAISVSAITQLNGENKISEGCSYLDPITIDILALTVAIFLVIEGMARILEHPQVSLKRQLTRPIRIAIGCAIITIHIIQFFYK